MKMIWRGSILLGALGLVTCAMAQRVEPNSFLDSRVKSTSDLLRQVKSHRDVRDRYMRHYGMSEKQLYAYLATFHVTKVKQAKKVKVYAVPSSGVVTAHVRQVVPGEEIFADNTGKAAMLALCGNPLELGPVNDSNVSLLGLPSIVDQPVLAMQALPEATGTPVMMIDPRPAIAMVAPPDTIADVVTDIPPITTTVVTAPPVTPTPPLTPAPPVVTTSSAGGNGVGAILPLLGGAGLLGILASNHGHSGPPVAPAPEPVTIVCFGAGALALLRRRRP